MTNLDREQVTVLTHQTKEALEVWRRERRAALARQLVANVETRLNWLESNPIEISQRQRGYHSLIQARVADASSSNE